MLKQNLMTCLGLCLAGILATAGCTNESDGESTGGLELHLELAGGAEIDEVLYQISGNEMPAMDGSIDTSVPGATASVEVFGLPEGGGYLVELRAVADGGTVCEGSARFDVFAGRATSVAVMLNCKPNERFGSVRVNGKLNVCAELAKVVVAPLETSVGSSIDLSMQGIDADGDPIAYSWSATGGPIAQPEAPVTRYTCASAGIQTIRAEVSDDEFGPCVDAWEIDVRCVSGGSVDGACTDSSNAMVYANLEYTDDDGLMFAGTDAAAAIGIDCIFGSNNSEPMLEGCGEEASDVLRCFVSGCPSETIAALADCVAACTQDATAEASPPGLSNDCVACTGDTVACGAAFCTSACVSDLNAPACIDCRCENNCIPIFDECSGLPPSGDCGSGGSGGTGGSGGSGGSVEDACTDSSNAMVYANLEYTDDDGLMFAGTDAAAAIGIDCIFGSNNSEPMLEGCAAEASDVIRCFVSGCPSETIAALADCVAACTQDATAEASPPGLSNDCVACTGDTVACGAAFCTNLCVADANAPVCIQCRCDNNCIPGFGVCSGLPPSGACN